MSEVDDFLSSYEPGKKPAASPAPTAQKPASEVDLLLQSAPAQDKGFSGHMRDIGLSAVKSAIAVPEMAVGLANIPTGGRVGKFLENEGGSFGFRPKEAKEFLSDLHTDKYKDQQRQFQEADGVLDKTAVALQNPSLIGNTVVESLAPMLVGGVIGRGIAGATTLGQMGTKGAAAAGAIGEGAVMAGAQAEGIRQQTDDGLLTPAQSGAAVATGALGSLFGYMGGRIAQRYGFGDIDTMMVQGANPRALAGEMAQLPAKSIPRQVIEGAITEGFLEELPQSISEQIIQNLALKKSWNEGVEDAAVMGTLAGMAMGGGASLYRGMATRGTQQPGDTPPEPTPPTDQQPLASDLFGPAGDTAINMDALERAGISEPSPAPVLNTDALDRWGVDTRSPSQQMGLDPNAGPMSAAAALAVDTGASGALAQAAQTVDPETGEITEPGALAEVARPVEQQAEDTPTADRLNERLAFVEQQAKRNGGWDRALVDERERIQGEIAKIAPTAPAPEPEHQPAVESPQREPAQTEFDVSARTPEQLQYLAANGQAGWKEAAQVELDRRTSTTGAPIEPTPPEAQQGEQKEAPQAAASTVAPTQASEPQSAPEAATQAATPSQWDGMTPGQRTVILNQPGGWSTAKGSLNVIGKQIAGRSWADMPEKTRETISALMGRQASVTPAPDDQTQQGAAIEPQGSVTDAQGQPPAEAPMPKAKAVKPSIRDVIAKQIPEMTDVELQQAIAHYGPEHKRTAKLQKEAQRRGQGATVPEVQQEAATQAESRDSLLDRLDQAEPMSDQESELFDKLKGATQADVDSRMSRGEMPVFATGKDTFATITESAQQPGKYQVTRYGAGGILGDTQYNSVEDAIRDNQFSQKRMLSQADADAKFAESMKGEAEYLAKKAEHEAKTKSSTAEAAQIGADSEPAGPDRTEFTTLKDRYGNTVTVRTADLNGTAERLKMFTKDGKPKASRIHRDNLDQTGEKRAEQAKAEADNPLFNVITAKNGGTFAIKAAAQREMNRRGLHGTHEVVAASDVQAGMKGYLVRKKADISADINPAEPLQQQAEAAEIAPEVATHKDPGQPAEPVTQPVIAEAIQKSARNTEFNPAEAKAWILAEIDKAIAAAPTADKIFDGVKISDKPATYAGVKTWTVDGPESADGLTPSLKIEQSKGGGFSVIWGTGEKESSRAPNLGLAKEDAARVVRTGKFDVSGKGTTGVWVFDAAVLSAKDFVTFDVPGDGRFKVVNTIEKLQEFRAKIASSPGFAKNPTRPLSSGSGTPGGATLDQSIADAKKFGGDPLEEIGNAIEIARLKGKGEDALLDRFIEESGGKKYDAWRAEQDAADEIAAREAVESATVFEDGALLPAGDLEAYYEQEIKGKAQGVRVPNPRFEIGVIGSETAREIAKYIEGYKGDQRRLRISGRTLKHIEESRPAIAQEIIANLQNYFTNPDEVLPDHKAVGKRALLIHRGNESAKMKSHVATVEVEIEIEVSDGFIDIVTVMTAPDRSLRAARELKDNWREGQQIPERAGYSPHPIAAEATHAEADLPNVPPVAKTIAEQQNERADESRVEAEKKSAPEKSDAPKSDPIRDIGEKIGGARKDIAESSGKGRSAKPKSSDDRPAWARRFEISQVIQSSRPSEVGKWSIRDSRKTDRLGRARLVGLYDSREEAEAAVPIAAVALKHRVVSASDGKYEIWRDVTERKRVKVVSQQFDTRNEAMQYLATNAAQIIETNTTFGEADLPVPESKRRLGAVRRDGDVKGEDFKSTFGFRGVEFGNWNNQAERQEVMNEAYDGLLDLAEVLNIPPAAISLNGDLALAFGARGNGLSGARAHYEPARSVINLTKMNGAGALAHEWFHALDHYFGRQDGKTSSEWVTNADGTRSLKAADSFERDAASGGFSRRNSGVRLEIRDAYASLMSTIFTKAEQYVEDTARADKFVAATRNEVSEQLDRLRKDLAEQKDVRYYKRNNKPASAEQLAEFDTLAQQIIAGTALATDFRRTETKAARAGSMAGMRWTNDALERLSAINKAVRGRSEFTADQGGALDRLRMAMTRYESRLKMLADAQSANEKTRSVPTSFAMDAKSLDQGRGTDYWTTPHEMAARAFQGYVEDKIAAGDGRSPFLNYAPENVVIETPYGWMRPYPAGKERVAINGALDKLVGEFQTKETDTGTAIYSQDQKRNSGITPTDKAIYGMSAEGKTATDILSFIAKASRSQFNRQVANLLLKSGINPTISIGDAKTWNMAEGGGSKYAAAYNAKTNTVALFRPANAERHMIHELMHAATIAALEKRGLASVQMKALFAHVKKSGKLKGMYGMTNVQEFVAEAFANPDFQRKLKTVNAPAGSKLRSAWDWLVRILRGALNLPVNQESALSAALETGVALVRENMRLAQSQGKTFGNQDATEAEQQLRDTERAYGGRDAYDRAKAAGKTKLNYRQWVQVRTPKFKAWFGNWEAVKAQAALDAMPVVDVRIPDGWRNLNHAELRQKMEAALDEMVRERATFDHPDLGTITVGRVGAKKSVSNARDPAKAFVVADIGGVIPSSVYARSEPSRTGDGPDIDGYSTLLAKVNVSGTPLIAVFTVRNQSDGKWYYNTVTLHDAQEKAQDSYGRPDQQAADSRFAPITGLDSFIRQPLRRVNPDSVSKVTDPDTGEPMVVYHGTAADFSAFSDEMIGSATDDGLFGRGFYFAPEHGNGTMHYGTAGAYSANEDGGNIMPVFVLLQNPLVVDPGKWGRVTADRSKYDGVIVKGKSEEAQEFVAFDPTQIKSAIGNNGDFDGTNPNILYNLADSAQDLARNIGDGLKSITVQDVKKAGRHKLTDWLKLGLQFLGRRQLVDIYGGSLPMADYDRMAAQMEADKNETGAAADDLARRWGKLKDERQLAELMHDATLAQIDADSEVPYAAGDSAAKSAALKAQFKQLSPDAQAVYREARDHYRAHHTEVRQAIIDRISRSELRSTRRAELLKRMDEDFFKSIKGVYFPLARFGQYVVVTKDASGKVSSVSRAETMAEAEAMRKEMVKAFPAADGFQVGRVTLSKEFTASRDMVGRGFMTELYDALDQQNLDPRQLAELEDTLGQLYLSSLPDLSWAKHGIHRKGTPGFSQDARRAFAQNTFHGARYLAKLRYGDQMQLELDKMQKHADQITAVDGFDQPAAQRVVDEMNKRHESMMNPKSSPISSALTSAGFIYYLGLSPAAAIVNVSQTPLVAYPVLGAKWGFKKAGAALMTASKETMEGKNDLRSQLKNADEIRAYDEAVRSGTIDVTMAHDLAGIAQGEDAKVMWKMRPVMRFASYLFHHAERFNRQATFLAAYRLARGTGVAHDTAYEQAVKATYDGHFDYSAGNRARVMQGNVARVVLLFKQYAQNMIFTIGRNAYQSVQGETPEVRREARRVFASLMAMHAAAAGVLGLPFVGSMLAVASALGGSDDEPWDAEIALRNMLADAFGKEASEVVSKGFSRLTPWDISGRVGLNHLLLPDVQEGLEGQRLAESFTTQMLGPVVGIGVNITKGAQKMAEGDYMRGLEDMLPIALRNPLKAYRFHSEGAQDRTGVEIAGDVSMAGVLGQASGFSPSEVRLAFEGKSAVMNADRRLNERRQTLMTQFARAMMDKDAEGMTEARERIAAFNSVNPGRRITPPQLMQSVKNRQRRIDQAQDGVFLPRNRRDALEAGAFAAG